MNSEYEDLSGKTMKTRESEIRKFISNASYSNDMLKDKLDNIKFQARSVDQILETLQFQSKDTAIKSMYELLKYIEVLWNQMISLETVVIYKNLTK